MSVTPFSHKNKAHTFITENCDLLDMWLFNLSFARPIAWKCHLRNKSRISDERARKVRKSKKSVLWTSLTLKNPVCKSKLDFRTLQIKKNLILFFNNISAFLCEKLKMVEKAFCMNIEKEEKNIYFTKIFFLVCLKVPR